jgi:hypothetical protein
MDKTGRTPRWLLLDLKCPINSPIFPSNFYPQTLDLDQIFMRGESAASSEELKEGGVRGVR